MLCFHLAGQRASGGEGSLYLSTLFNTAAGDQRTWRGGGLGFILASEKEPECILPSSPINGMLIFV